MPYGTGKLWKAAAALLLALVVSLGTLGVAQATHPVSDPKAGWYKVGGSAADRMLSKQGGVVATWTQVKMNPDYSWRAYWTVKNRASKSQRVGCAGYQHYGLKGYKAKVFYHTTFNYEWHAKDAKCVHLGGAYRQMLQPGQTITSWADFKYSGKKGTCTMLTLPTGPNVPEHVGFTKCVDPYARYLGPRQNGTGGTGDDRFSYPMDLAQRTGSVKPYDEQNPGLADADSPCYRKPMKELWHAGEDWFAPVNTPIKAVGEGVVTYVSPSWYSYPGAVVIIEHTLPGGGRIWSMYGHLANVTVSEGGHVTKGHLTIADSLHNWPNNTHLHWEMRYFPDGSEIKKAPDYKVTCSGPPGPGYTYPGRPDNFVANGGAGPKYRWTDPSAFVKAH